MHMRRPITATAAAAVMLLAQAVSTAQSTAPAAAPVDTLRIYLARHGQTEGNRTGRAQGWTDTPLNETGQQQAAQLAATLKGVGFDAIYSSTLSRSRQTAEAVAAGRPVTSLPGLREMNLGRFEDRPIGDPELRKRQPGPDNPDDGESGTQFYERVSGAVQEILARHRSGTILIVGHAGANQQILRTLLTLTPEQTRTVLQGNDELYQIDVDSSGGRRIWKLVPVTNLKEL
jgi:broad specificity phosphatase PhoE